MANNDDRPELRVDTEALKAVRVSKGPATVKMVGCRCGRSFAAPGRAGVHVAGTLRCPNCRARVRGSS